MIRLGTAGWSYKDWYGVVYPKTRPKGFSEIGYIAQYFDTIEINASFYRPIRPQFSYRWLGEVAHNKHFRFAVKLWRKFTHERNAVPEDVQTIKAGLQPLLEAKQLGAVLVQFPWSFKRTDDHQQYIRELQSWFHDYPLLVEVRHNSWMEPETINIFTSLGIGFCNIDQPVLSSSVSPSAISTSPVGYIRLHGRNYEQWFAENQSPGDRYNYLYSVDELQPWVARIRAIAAQSDDTYVIANNCYLGKAVVNIVELASLLTGKPVEAPPQLIQHYPILGKYVI